MQALTPHMYSEKLLRVINVRHSFARPVLCGVSYVFKPGVSYAVMGPSGAGKSTLLALLGGLLDPQEGAVQYGDIVLSQSLPTHQAQRVRTQLGMLFQTAHLIDELSLYENVMIQALIAGVDGRATKERAAELLAQVGLAHKAAQRVRSLSGGEQQRVALARTLCAAPRFILADEPTAHVDTALSEAMLEVLLSYQKNYKTGLVLVTHDAQLAARCDVQLTLEDGYLRDLPRAVQQKSPYERTTP